MKIIRPDEPLATKHKEYPIRQAVFAAISDADARGGDTANASMRMMGRLVELLHANGALSDADVMSLLHEHGFKSVA